MVTQTCNLNPKKEAREEWPRVPGKPGLHSEFQLRLQDKTLFQTFKAIVISIIITYLNNHLGIKPEGRGKYLKQALLSELFTEAVFQKSS